MALINLRSLGATLGAPLFSNLNLAIETGDRLGVVAANGRGKTTLLRCIAGMFEPTAGEVTRTRGLRIGYVEQDLPAGLGALTFREMVHRALPSAQAESEGWRVDVVLESLEAPEALRERPLSALSGGWQRLALLARAWVTEPDVLLLDEPTNHLDLARIGQLEDWLNALPRDVPVVICSHDRAFLDAVTNRTLFLRLDASQIFSLPYSRARAALGEIDASEVRRFQKDMKTAQQLRRQAAKLNNIGINSGSDLLTVKTKRLKHRAQRIEDAARSAYQERSAGAIKLANRSTHARVLITLDDAAVTTPANTLLLRTGKLWICQGDRVVLLGRNGAGKTRLLNMIRQSIVEPDTADSPVRSTPSLLLGYGDQELANLPNDDMPLALISRRFELGEQRARSLLAGAGIGIDMQSKPIRSLSGGHRARLGMLVLRLTAPNFYLLDEPTNHLDIEGQEALESELTKHASSCLLVSHDRSFVRAVGTRFWLIEKRRIVEVEGPEDFFADVAKGEG
jgi:ATPase subunit of ABC transporter with duplicated ATPase domains